MYTVTVWGTEFDSGSFVAGIEEFNCLIEARDYLQGYEGDINLHVVLEQHHPVERSTKLAEVDPHGRLFTVINGEWCENNDHAFALETRRLFEVARKVRDRKAA